MKWTILFSDEGRFITSDCPVCRQYPITGENLVGLMNHDIKIYFPFTHNRLMMLEHDHLKIEKVNNLMKRGKNTEAERLKDSTHEITYRYANKTRVDELNKLIIERANRWIYAPSEATYIPRLFVGKSKNIRMEMIHHKELGLLQLKQTLE